MAHRPLSQELEALLAHPDSARELTVNQLIDKTEGRGAYLVMVVLNLPFIMPVPLWGLSTVFGLAVAILASRMLFGAEARLPASLGGRRIPKVLCKAIAGGGVKVLRWLERIVRPRRSQWMGWRATRTLNAALIVLMALLLSLPLPIFFSNSFPALATILIAVSMMEEDGVTIFYGYGMCAATFVFFGLFAGTIISVLTRGAASVRHYLTGS
jgi:hypothetical protein